MVPYAIAVEPPHGWSGLTPAQSKVGFQWLHIQDQKLGGEPNPTCSEWGGTKHHGPLVGESPCRWV